MKERPLICNAREVRGLLAGSVSLIVRPVLINCSGRVQRGHKQWHVDDPHAVLACPIGAPGDRLWVRETWHPHPSHSGPASYRAEWGPDDEPPDEGWRSPATMPRRASRITLDVVSVKVVRLWSITDAQALRAGATQAEADEAGVTPRDEFARLWQERWGKRFSWESNPWVWVVGVRRARA